MPTPISRTILCSARKEPLLVGFSFQEESQPCLCDQRHHGVQHQEQLEAVQRYQRHREKSRWCRTDQCSVQQTSRCCIQRSRCKTLLIGPREFVNFSSTWKCSDWIFQKSKKEKRTNQESTRQRYQPWCCLHSKSAWNITFCCGRLFRGALSHRLWKKQGRESVWAKLSAVGWRLPIRLEKKRSLSIADCCISVTSGGVHRSIHWRRSLGIWLHSYDWNCRRKRYSKTSARLCERAVLWWTRQPCSWGFIFVIFWRIFVSFFCDKWVKTNQWLQLNKKSVRNNLTRVSPPLRSACTKI